MFQSPENRIFPNGLTIAFGQKMQFFSLLFSVKKRLEIRFNDVLERKEPFFNIKTTFLNVSKIEFFQKG